jgi:hypothetical protein
MALAASCGFLGNKTFSINLPSSLKANMPKEHSTTVAIITYASSITEPIQRQLTIPKLYRNK